MEERKDYSSDYYDDYEDYDLNNSLSVNENGKKIRALGSSQKIDS